jgi:transaldolase/glucose-6-phosphate isomerase
LRELHDYGQSVWLDYMRRSLLDSGELQRLVDEDGVHGVTSNPSIFEKAIGGSTDYSAALEAIERVDDRPAGEIYEILAVDDIQRAADVLRPVYDQTDRRDGYVSLEVSPLLARDTDGTIAEARRLWQTVGRENLMIKVPGTEEGLPAISRLIGEGVNVNVTLLFALERYEEVVEAFLQGLERHAASDGDLHRMASVASFFVSRVDTAVDALLAERMKTASPAEQEILRSIKSKVAIANARLAYQRYKELFRGPRWEQLERRGAQTQRLLWASTSTKDPTLSDVLYVEDLIGADTVNTLPPATIDAFRDHGHPRPSLDEDVEEARATIEALDRVGISLAEVTAQLTGEGVRLFAESFDKLLSAVDEQRRAVLGRL